MLFVHEVHRVIGAHEEAFEEAFRCGWLPTLAQTDDARLLYYLRHAHGTGRAYNVITVTAVADAAAWGALVRRIESGDLTGWARHVDALRHDVTAKVLIPVDWSPLQEVNLDRVPIDGGEHRTTLFLEDTAWPFEGKVEAYLDAARDNYLPALEAGGRPLLHLEAVYRPAWGTGARRREVVLWQQVMDPKRLVALFASEVPAEHRVPGTWMHDALTVRDDWESRLLRTAAWSPLY